MASPAELMALGMGASMAYRLGCIAQLTVSAAGSAITDATVLTGSFIEVSTCGAGAGVQLPAGPGIYVVYNGGANALKVYPPTSSYMNGTQNAAFSVTNAKTGIFFREEARIIGVLSA